MIRHTREVFQGTPVYDFVAGTENAYATNSLNQYRGICSAEANQLSSLQLSYDDDGNATSVQTSTGTWNVEYNAENRPVRWTNAATGTVITMTFDSQGRRTEYKSVTNGAQNTWLRFLYDGYLCVHVLYSNEPYNVFKEFVWDPTEPVATRPLVFRYAPNSLNLFYAFDGNKNVSDVFYRMTSNGIGAHYDYAPFGATTRTHRDSSASFDIVSLNPFRFSSEYYDSELDLVYYNYRHYSPSLGRFLSRDPIEEQGGLNLYAFVGNRSAIQTDFLGLRSKTVVLKGGLGVWAGELSYEEMTDTCKPSISNLSVLKSDVDNPFTYLSLIIIDLVEVSIEQVINKELRPIKKELCLLAPAFVRNGSRQTVSYEVGIKYKIKWFSVPVDIPIIDISIGISEEATYTKIISVTGRCCCDSN